MSFYNRDRERAAIEQRLSSSRAELVIVYGRRGSGKSELLLRAIGDRHAVYYQATAEVLAHQLVDLRDAVQQVAGENGIFGSFTTLGEALAAIGAFAHTISDQAFVLVIDEFPYLADVDRGTETVFQRWWDRIYNDTPNLKVFLAGSHVSWMREHTLSEHGPLQNRRTGQIEVLPLDYRHAAEFYPHFSLEEKISAYGIWGGLPGFLREIDPSRGLWENVDAGLLDPSARLFEEPDWLRFTDLRADSLYTSLIRAIAMGQHTPSDLARETGRKSAADVFSPLGRLVDLGILMRRQALHVRKESRPQTRYELNDQFLAFWYRFIDRRRSMLRRGFRDIALVQIQADFDQYIGQSVFENVCREWMWTAAARGYVPPTLTFSDVGGWWSGRREEQDEIDVVAIANDEGVVFGECKWSNAPMDLRDLGGIRGAIEASRRDLRPIMHPWRCLFSKSGFHPDLVAEAKDPENRIVLVGLEDLYGLP